MSSRNIIQEIQDTIDNNSIVLFLKGEKGAAMCGFSSQILLLFEELEQKYNISFKVVNVWKDQTLYDALKEYNDWPTYPQIFVNHEFVGGFDIINEMNNDGELEELISSISQN